MSSIFWLYRYSAWEKDILKSQSGFPLNFGGFTTKWKPSWIIFRRSWIKASYGLFWSNLSLSLANLGILRLGRSRLHFVCHSIVLSSSLSVRVPVITYSHYPFRSLLSIPNSWLSQRVRLGLKLDLWDCSIGEKYIGVELKLLLPTSALKYE